MKCAELRRSQMFREGASRSAIVWFIYGILEALFSSVLYPISRGFGYTPPDVRLTAALFLVYPALGFLLGGVVALGVRFVKPAMPAHAASSWAAMLGLVVVFAANLQYALSFPSNALLTAVCGFIALALMASFVSEARSRRVGFVTNPWTAGTLLLGVGWLTKELLANYPDKVRAGAAAAYFLGALLIAFAVSLALRRMEHAREGGYSARSWAMLTGLAVMVTAAAALLTGGAEGGKIPAPGSSRQPGRPNVIFIVMDTVRADHLSAYKYGRDTTPNLRKLAEEATLYSNAISSGDMTLSTHASMFTGLYPSYHGAHFGAGYSWAPPLARQFRTLAEVLSETGYATIAVISNYGFLGREFHLDRGFQYYAAVPPVMGRSPEFYLRQTLRDTLVRIGRGQEPGLHFRRAADINAEALPLLRTAVRQAQPFFFFLNYMDAHGWYNPPAPYDTLYPGKDAKLNAELPTALGEVMSMKRDLSSQEQRHIISQYDGGIAYLDYHLGRLFDSLRELGVYDECLLIVTSDHGEALGEKQLMWHGNSVYQDEVHVPLIVKYPGQRQKVVSADPASSVDLMPTILDVARIPIPREVQGQSLRGAQPNRVIFSETFPYQQLMNWHPRFHRIGRAVIAGENKLISATSGQREFYDLARDPDELHNLYGPNSNRALQAALDQFIKGAGPRTAPAGVISKESIERLKSLGYVQ